MLCTQGVGGGLPPEASFGAISKVRSTSNTIWLSGELVPPLFNFLAITNACRGKESEQGKKFVCAFEIRDCPLFGMVLPHATWTVGGCHVGVGNMHDSVLGNVMHPHRLFVLKTMLALGARPVFLNGRQAHF